MTKKVVSIGTQGSYSPAVLLDELNGMVADIDFLVVGVVTKDGYFFPAWTSHERPAQQVALATDMIKAANLSRNGPQYE